MPITADQVALEAKDFLAIHDHLERECVRMEQFTRIRPVLLKLSSLANAESEIKARIREANTTLAEAEAKIAGLQASVETARREASDQIAAAQENARQTLADLEATTAEEARKITAEVDAKKQELRDLVAKIEGFRASVSV